MIEKFAVQLPDEDRHSLYKSIIREEFAKKNSIFFCLPTVHEVERFFHLLSVGIENHSVMLHGEMSSKKISQAWTNAVEKKFPVVIIATSKFISIPRDDIKILVVEQESSPSYYSMSRPYINLRRFIESLCQHRKIKLIFGDSILRVETLYRLNSGELIPLSPPRYRYSNQAQQKIIDTTSCKEDTLSEEAKELIINSLEKNQKTFLFINRRGLFTLTVCRDCGQTMICGKCHSPLAIHGSSKGNNFICHRCQSKYEALDKCVSCGGWRLATLGIGIERVEKDLKDMGVNAKIVRIDSDSVKTGKRALELIQDFYDAPRSVLIGTEMALNYLNKPIDNMAIVSMDSMLMVPDYLISEKIFRILIRVREMAISNFIIQTRMPDNILFQQAIRGNILEFYKGQIEEREKFGYPPFTTIIKVTNLKDKKVSFMKSPEWPDEKLVNRLKKLPPSYIIQINPENSVL